MNQKEEIAWRLAEYGMPLDEEEHHECCPMSRSMRSTSCHCEELRAADKAAAMEFRYDCMLDR